MLDETPNSQSSDSLYRQQLKQSQSKNKLSLDNKIFMRSTQDNGFNSFSQQKSSHNPFIHPALLKDSIQFTQPIPRQQPNPIIRQSSHKPFTQPNQDYTFPHKLKSDQQKQSAQFQFNNDDSGSLFSSQNSSISQNIQHNSSGNKNVENYRKLLKEYYNENYLNSKIQLGRQTSIMITNSIRRSDIPFFINREPIVFHKRFQGVRSVHGLSGNYLCKLIDNKVYYKNVTSDELMMEQQIKCDYIPLNISQSISPSLEIEATTGHLFYYSNTTNEIVVIRLDKIRKEPEICRIKCRIQRKNPLLYLISINKQTILLLIGGYTQFNKLLPLQVEGCKFIEAFSINKWGTDIIKSRLIKLITGKIYPLIVFPVKIQQNDSILLIGGNTLGKISGNQLNFKDYKVVNQSSNLRGVFINTKVIIESFQQNKDMITLHHGNNLTVQIQDKINLFNGYVDLVKSGKRQKIRLFLPKMKQFYTMKVVKNQVRIIKSKQNQERNLTFQPNQDYNHLQLKSFRKPNFQYYQINGKGNFQKKMFKLNPYDLSKHHFRCPCQFM